MDGDFREGAGIGYPEEGAASVAWSGTGSGTGSGNGSGNARAKRTDGSEPALCLGDLDAFRFRAALDRIAVFALERGLSLEECRKEFELAMVKRGLRTFGTGSRAAQALGISRNSMSRKRQEAKRLPRGESKP